MEIINGVINNIIGEISLVDFFTFFVLAFVGLVLSILVELYKRWPKIKEYGGFSFGTWIKENGLRIIIGIMFIPLAIVFSDDLLGVHIGKFTAFLMGFTQDKFIDMLVNRKK
jgi:hypothetical protein